MLVRITSCISVEFVERIASFASEPREEPAGLAQEAAGLARGRTAHLPCSAEWFRAVHSQSLAVSSRGVPCASKRTRTK